MTRLALTLTVLILTVLAPTQAPAQSICAPRDNIRNTLERSYGEAKAGMGLQGQTMIFELWFSSTTGTWSFTRTTTDGITCLLVSGDNWINLIPDYAIPTTSRSTTP